jgi:hypothetical protein
MDSILQSLVTSGPLGIAVVALGYAVLRLYTRIDEIQEKRVADAQVYAQKMSEAAGLIRDHTATLQRFIDIQRNGAPHE